MLSLSMFGHFRFQQENGDPLVGGRAYSPAFQSKNRDYVNEMGPMRVPENSKLFWHYFSKVLQEKHSGDPSGDPNELQKLFPNPGVVATQLIFRGLKNTVGRVVGTPHSQKKSQAQTMSIGYSYKRIYLDMKNQEKK